MEPNYTLEQIKIRIIVPEFLKLIALVSIFYLALILNLFLLDFSLTTMVHVIIIIILVLLAAIEVFLKVNKSKSYYFYQDKVTDGINSIYYYQSNIQVKKNLFDKIFKTETLILSDNFQLKNIKEDNQIYAYIQGLIQYAKGGYNGP